MKLLEVAWDYAPKHSKQLKRIVMSLTPLIGHPFRDAKAQGDHEGIVYYERFIASDSEKDAELIDVWVEKHITALGKVPHAVVLFTPKSLGQKILNQLEPLGLKITRIGGDMLSIDLE